MIGTRHEQAVLVVLAYVVGFVTAYIAYGISNYESAKVVYIDSSAFTEERAYADERVTAAVTGALNSQAAAVYEAGMLFANVGEEQYVLSVDVDAVDASMIDMSSFAVQGLHEAMPRYEVSPDGNFIFFCEQMQSEDTCRAFVFSIVDDIIRPITIEGIANELSISSVMSASWTDAGLSVGEYASVSPATPWILAVQ